MRMITLAALALLAGGAGCRAAPEDGSPADTTPSAEWDAPSETGPVLIGVVRDPSGRALEGIPVTLYAGFATRFRVASTKTDAHGRFRFDDVRGSQILDEDSGRWDWYVGVCAGSVESGNPAAQLPWKDVRVPAQPGAVERVDFVFDSGRSRP